MDGHTTCEGTIQIWADGSVTMIIDGINYVFDRLTTVAQEITEVIEGSK